MKKVLVSPITNKIYYGDAKRIDENLFDMKSDKVDITDDCIEAVYQWFLNCCKDEDSKFYQIKFAENPWLTMDCSSETAENRIKKLESENNSMFFEITGIMHFVDKWLEGKELELNNVQRADTAREKALKIIEDLQKQIPKEGEWKPNCSYEPDYYTCSVCDNDFTLIDGSPKDNGYNFCPSCGAKLKGD